MLELIRGFRAFVWLGVDEDGKQNGAGYKWKIKGKY